MEKVTPNCSKCESMKQYLLHKKIKHLCYDPEVKDGKGKTIGDRSFQTCPSWCPKRVENIQLTKTEGEENNNENSSISNG